MIHPSKQTPATNLELAYRKLYRRLGGRPWTYILRDVWHELEYLPGCLLVIAGFAAGQYCSWQALAAGWAVFTLGYVAGHLFWGTPWHKGQRGGQTRGVPRKSLKGRGQP